MTTPESPTPGEILRAIGRLEKTTDSLGAKIDRLDDKLDGHADQITRHELRIGGLEKKNEAEQFTRNAQAVQIKGALVAGAIAFLIAIGDAVITFTHH